MRPPEPPTAAPAATAPVSTKPVLAKAAIVLLLTVIAAVAYCIPQVHAYFDKTGPVAQWFRALGGFGFVVFILGAALLILVGVPRLALCTIAGVLYGFWIGLAVSLAASMISYYVGFVWIRGRRHKGLNREDLPKQLAFLAGDPGIFGVMIGRVVPAPGMLVTMALALSNVSDGAYLLGSAVGLIPEAVPAVLLGSMQKNFMKWGKMAALAVLGIALLWVVIHHLTRRFASKRIGSA